MSFILDALRKSEHERQRAAVPGLAQVPLATPQPQMPRWALGVIGALAAAVLALAAAWWQSSRVPAEPLTAATIERPVELPQTPAGSSARAQAAPTRPVGSEPLPEAERASASDAPSATAFSLERAAASSVSGVDAARPSGAVNAAATAPAQSTPLDPVADAATLPSAAALAAEGVALPPLRLELHAYGAERRDRFVFINGRKYAEGERLVEGPQLQSIEPMGAVLAHAGRRFLLVQE